MCHINIIIQDLIWRKFLTVGQLQEPRTECYKMCMFCSN